MTTSSPSDALASNRENCTTSSPRLTSFTIFFFSNIMKNLLFEEQVSPDFQVSKFSYYRISWKICYLTNLFKIFILYIEYLKISVIWRTSFLKFTSFSIFFNKFHNFHSQIIKKKIVIGRTIYYIIYVLTYYCDCLFGLTKHRKRLLLLFGK